MKKIAIGLPVYNGARYLAAAIDSILAQSYGDFDLLISDNASTDGTEEICRNYAQRIRASVISASHKTSGPRLITIYWSR
jgi:glycosyltransferase involved in cell wall biosynthesis